MPEFWRRCWLGAPSRRPGVPWFGADLSGDIIPLEALLDDSVSITKGCYPGQEVVARIKNLEAGKEIEVGDRVLR